MRDDIIHFYIVLFTQKLVRAFFVVVVFLLCCESFLLTLVFMNMRFFDLSLPLKESAFTPSIIRVDLKGALEVLL